LDGFITQLCASGIRLSTLRLGAGFWSDENQVIRTRPLAHFQDKKINSLWISLLKGATISVRQIPLHFRFYWSLSTS